ncbi:hypothetical protein ACU8KH_00745 [Lachancea thermotolerans]
MSQSLQNNTRSETQLCLIAIGKGLLDPELLLKARIRLHVHSRADNTLERDQPNNPGL